jgi:hypothetical protein
MNLKEIDVDTEYQNRALSLMLDLLYDEFQKVSEELDELQLQFAMLSRDYQMELDRSERAERLLGWPVKSNYQCVHNV